MTVRLDYIAQVVRGVTFSKADGSVTQTNDRLPVIRAGSIQKSLLLDEGQIWVPKEKVKANQLIRKDDIVICTSSGSSSLVGKCAKADRDWNGSFGAFCAGIRPDCNKCDPSYLYHFLCSPLFRNWTKSSAGANIKNIRASELADFKIPLPPLNEQKRIAAILNKADAIRRKRQQAIELADQFLRSVFLDMFGDPKTNNKDWKIGALSSLVRGFEGGKNIKPDESGKQTINRILKVSAVTTGHFKQNQSKPLPNHFEPPTNYYANKGDLLISRANTAELIGATALVNYQPLNIVLPDKIWRFLWKDIRYVSPQYIHHLFKLEYIRREISIRSSGTSGSMKNIPKSKLLEIKIPIPPIEMQKKFEKIVKQFNSTRNKATDGDVITDKLCRSLSQRAFRGELTQNKAA